MTTPPQPQPPAPAPAPAPQPPAPAPTAPAGQPAPANGTNGDAPTRADLDALRASLEAERTARRETEQRLSQLQQQGMSDSERAVAAAREEGRAEAQAAAARQLAAAEFRHLATGRITDPDAAIEMLDLDKLVKDGQPNRRAIAALVDRLAAVPAPAPAGHVPAGPRAPGTETDWLGAQVRAVRGG